MKGMCVRRLVYFIHHQGRGHAQRFAAIADHLRDVPMTALCAKPELLQDAPRHVEIPPLPDMIGAPSSTGRLAEVHTPPSFHCLPLGSRAMTEAGAAIAHHVSCPDVGLFVCDVSAEWTILGRLLSIPTMKIRMHGDRSDPGHVAAYQSAVGMIAPFAQKLEQADYPAWAREKTFYSGGLASGGGEAGSRENARRRLGLPLDREVVVIVSGGGGSGTPFAPITMAARARPEALFLTVGPVARDGHETDFPNICNLGWTGEARTYIAAADVIIASAGDNTVHEIAEAGRPFLCIPAWRYFNEQTRKAEALQRVNAAATLPGWPASTEAWVNALDRAYAVDLDVQRSLFCREAAAKIAAHLRHTMETLWSGVGPALASEVA